MKITIHCSESHFPKINNSDSLTNYFRYLQTAHQESLILKQARLDSKLELNNDCGHFAFGDNHSPKPNNLEENHTARPREVEDWLLNDKWGDTRYTTVPDSEAATAIESILNEELS